MAPLYAATVRNPAQFLGNVIARGLAWMMIGGFIGLGDGFRTRSVQTGRNGAIGGLLGGFLGGLLFECVPYLLPTLKVGAVSRMIGFATTGFVIELALRSRHESGSDHVDGHEPATRRGQAGER